MKKLLIAAAAFATLAAPSIAAADPPHQARYEQSRHGERNIQRSYVVNGHRYNAQAGPRWDAPRNYQRQSWRRGQTLQRDYRRVVVTDYDRRHLARPAYGQQWVRVDGDALLVAAATGLIIGVVAGAFN